MRRQRADMGDDRGAPRRLVHRRLQYGATFGRREQQPFAGAAADEEAAHPAGKQKFDQIAHGGNIDGRAVLVHGRNQGWDNSTDHIVHSFPICQFFWAIP